MDPDPGVEDLGTVLGSSGDVRDQDSGTEISGSISIENVIFSGGTLSPLKHVWRRHRPQLYKSKFYSAKYFLQLVIIA